MSKREKLDEIKADIETMKRISGEIDSLMLALENILKGNLKSVTSFRELAERVRKHKTMGNQKGGVELDDWKLIHYKNILSELKNVPIRGIMEALEKEKSEILGV